MPTVENTNGFKVRVKFEAHGIPGARIKYGETLADPRQTVHVATGHDLIGVLSVYRHDSNKKIYWCNTSGKAHVKV